MGPGYRKRILAIVLFCAAAGVAAGQPKNPPPDKVPEDFPKDCPIMSNSTIRDYMPAMKNRTLMGHILVLETAGSEKDVVEYYRKELPVNGWTVLKHPKSEADLLEGNKAGRRVLLGIVATRQGANPTTTFRLVAIDKH